MSKKRLCGAAVLAGAAMAGLSSQTDAAISISIANVSVFAGTTAVVGVYASSNDGDIISGFNLPLDINDDGMEALPTGFTLNGSGFSNAVYANTGLDTLEPQITLINVDSIPTGSGTNIMLSTTPTLLFDLDVNVAGSVAAGTVVPLEIEVPASPYSPLFNVAGPDTPTVAAPVIGTPVDGSITVVAVPEPAAILPVALVALLGVAGSRRSRRLSQLSPLSCE
jgi:hypothetical protein